jgi:tetratricopeptide (TPR) repeat protein
MLFLMADSYRKSAGVLEERIAAARAATTRPALDLSEAATARSQRLQRAEELYAQAGEWYRAHAPTRDIDRLYMKLAYFYRGDCAYDLGKYEEAIRLYGDAAFRYQEDALALTAYVQIVNANVALGKTEEAKAANERAKWMLRRMPQEAFTQATGGMSRAYWEQWLKWSGESGLWK